MTQLLETTFSESLNVDRDAGVIRNVKILGRDSKNGREYTPEAMSQAAALYEGRRVYIDHPDRSKPNAERKYADCFGQLESVQVRDGAVFGDMHFLKSHEQAEKVCESAERFPRTFGLSHNAEGKTARRNGKVFVESVVDVRSVDIVSQPATNAGLFESEDPMPKKSIREVVSALPENTPYRKQLLEMEGAEQQMEVPAEDASPEQAIKKAFIAKIAAIIEDDSIDLATTTQRVKDLLKSLEATKEKAVETDPESEESPAPEEEGEMAESVRELNAKLKRMEARDECRSLMESEGVKGNETLLEALIPLSGDKRKELIKQFKPSGSQRLTESSGINPGLKRDQPTSETEERWNKNVEKARQKLNS